MNKYAAKIRASRNTKQGQGTEEARGAIFIGMIVEVLSEELTVELRNEQSKEVTFISAKSRCKGPGVGPRLVFSRNSWTVEERVAEGSHEKGPWLEMKPKGAGVGQLI